VISQLRDHSITESRSDVVTPSPDVGISASPRDALTLSLHHRIMP
jgi:hypothetical protein